MNRPTYSSFLRVVARMLSRAGAARVFAAKGVSLVAIDSAFPGWLPNSSGPFKERAEIAIDALANAPTSLLALVAQRPEVITVDDFVGTVGLDARADALAELLNLHGSDKASTHDYYRIYATILCRIGEPQAILEVGLGTNNTDVLSNMGSSGRPGASLRAFRDFCPQTHVIGADIDDRILFSENRIDTYQLDQLDPKAWSALRKSVVNDVDLLIDDGLHAFSANLKSIEYGLPMVRKGGWLVIEDIDPRLAHAWSLVQVLLAPGYRTYQVACKAAHLLAIECV